MSLQDEIDASLKEIIEDVVAFRHQRHQTPELTWAEESTSAAVEAALRAIPGIKVETGIAKYGVVGLIEGASPGPCVALRADMDALPIEEKTGVAYTSQHEGVMHACGHDGHMANLLGAAKILAKQKDKIKGTIKLIFQPAEEGGAGAREMCDAGVLENPKVDVIFGLHGWPEQQCGKIFVKEGPMMASQTVVKIAVKGKGGHAALPHLGTDQVLTASRIVVGLQEISSRYLAPTEPVAVSICKIKGGTATNVIPDVVHLEGTVRAVTHEVRDRVLKRIEEIATGIGKVQGADVEVTIVPGYPPTINHPEPTAFVKRVAEETLGQENVDVLAHPTMGAEDFSFFLERVPGCYFFLGVSDGRDGGYPSLHQPQFDFNDKALPTGIKMFVNLALNWT